MSGPVQLNKAIMRRHCPMRTLDDILPKVSGAKYFSRLDASSGYWTVMLPDETSLQPLTLHSGGTVIIVYRLD